MSETVPRKVFGSLPRTTRGTPIVVGKDVKNKKNFLYANNNSVFIRDINDPSICDVYTQHSHPVNVAQYSPSGFYICSGDASGKVRIWDTVNREHILKAEYQPLGGGISDVAWSGDSQTIAVCGDGREKYAHVFGMDTGTSKGELGGLTEKCNSIAFKEVRPFRIALGSEDKASAFYEGPPFKFKHTNKDHSNFCNVVRYSPDGSIYVTAGADGKVFVYDGKDGSKTGEIGAPAHKGGIYALCFNDSGSELLTVSGDKTAKIWNVQSKELVVSFEIGKTLDDMLVGCIWQGDNVVVVALSGYLYYLDRNNPGTPARIIKGHNKPITAMALSEDRSTIYTADSQARVVVWNANSGENDIINGQGHKNQIQDMAVANNQLISIGMDDTVRFTDLSQNQFGGNSVSLPSLPKAVAANKNGLVAIACENHIVVLKNGSLQITQGVNFEPLSVDIQGESSRIAIGGEKDNKIHFYDVSSGGLTPENEIDIGTKASDLKFSPDGQYIAAAGADRKVKLYSVSDYKRVIDYPAHSARVTCLAWSPDSSRFASGSIDTNLAIFKPSEPMSPKIIKGAHPISLVNRVAWLNDNVLVSAGQDSNVKQWDV